MFYNNNRKVAWEGYKQRRIAEGKDGDTIDCENTWEVDYLTGKLTLLYPDTSPAITVNSNYGMH